MAKELTISPYILFDTTWELFGEDNFNALPEEIKIKFKDQIISRQFIEDLTKMWWEEDNDVEIENTLID